MTQPSIGPRPTPSVSDAEVPVESETLPAGYSARTAELDDLEAVHELESMLFPEDAWPIDMFLAEISHPARRYTVVEAEGELIAYSGMMAVADTGDVQTVAIRPGHEGRGIGRWLMNRMHEQARAMGAETMMLEVRADNPRAQGLYTFLGYEPIHERRGYYQGGVDAVIMSLDLKAGAERSEGSNR
ncbi:ribosomal protein S18-alanine N-acetyltransferase [Rothia sp. HC945]|uniref:ribosomal protein S18-alanine N-acetyltransferase n=1 Tax=Rothia sp. HC945 TaxID=3171170 RepID=UPI003F1EE709